MLANYSNNNFFEYPIIKRIILLLVTGMPGLQKIVLLFCVGIVFEAEGLASFINDVFIIQIISLFTGFNWANILLADIHKYPERLKNKFFSKIFFLTVSYSISFASILVILFVSGWIVDIVGSIVYLVFYSIYQVWRHRQIALEAYLNISILDTFILVISSLLTFLSFKAGWSLLLLHSIPLVVPVILCFVRENISFIFFVKPFQNDFNKSLNIRSLQNAMSNFTTASLSLFIAPISYRFLTSEYTAVIGVFNNISNVMLLIPRSIAIQNLPILAKAYRQGKCLARKFNNYRDKLFKILLLLFGVGLVATLVVFGLKENFNFLSSDLPHISTICILMLLSTLLSQISLPLSNLVLITRQEYILLKINLSAFMLFVFLFLIIYLIGSNGVFLIIFYQVLLIAQHIFRYARLTNIYKYSTQV